MANQRDLFLSHSSANKDIARMLAADIESREFKSRKLLTWFDEAEIGIGQSITGLVNSGLENSRFFAILMSPDYFSKHGSGWTDAEWHSALYSDPDNRGKRILPLLIEDCPYLPPLLMHLRYIDLRKDNYEKGIEQIVNILSEKPIPGPTRQNGQVINSSGNIDKTTLFAERAIPQGNPEASKERLRSNVFPVLSLPRKIYIGSYSNSLMSSKKNGEKRMPTKSEIKDVLHQIQIDRGYEKIYIPIFRCHEDQIFTFYDLNDQKNLLHDLVDQGTVTEERIGDLLGSDKYYGIIISLLNMALSRHVYRCGLIVDQTKYARYFFPSKDGQPNIVRYKSFKNTVPRTVAKPIKKEDIVISWLHQGAYLKLIQLGKKFFLIVNPTWVLTTDGTTPAGGKDVARTVNRWTNAERNESVLRHNKFWSAILSKGKKVIEIYAGDQLLKIDSRPAFCDMDFGIPTDHIQALEMEAPESLDDVIERTLAEDDYQAMNSEVFEEEYDYEDYDLGEEDNDLDPEE
ncbi:toll/interleukin-1 receptor domain-containing protein [Reichenbachiella sp.]|uniref:toll/interleukin-1 receptor domain-containing protein n=1 Tax=Reichenbachiella sp. TaxID=2184521 RepID=UPI003BAF4B07